MKPRKLCTTLLILILISSLTFSGCSNTGENQSEGTASDTVTITYAMWQTNMTDYMKERIAAFEAENPNIKIELQVPDNYQTSYEDYWSKINGQAAVNLPDVFVMQAGYYAQYEKDGKLRPIDSLIKKNTKIDMSKCPENLAAIYNTSDTQYGIPIDYDTIGLWYNMELFDAAGLSYPNSSWTWSDFTAAAAKLTDAGRGTYGVLALNEDQLGYYNTIYGCGGTIVNEDGSFGFDDPATQRGLQAWVDLTSYSPTLDEIAASGGPHVLFMQGKAAMVFGGDWEAADFTSKDSLVAGKINVCELPIMNDGTRKSVIHGKANVISAGSKHPQAAEKFLAFISSQESYEKLGNTGLVIPASSDYASLFFKQYPQYDMGIFAREAVDSSEAYPSSSAAGWTEKMNAMTEKMMRRTISVPDGCAALMEELK